MPQGRPKALAPWGERRAAPHRGTYERSVRDRGAAGIDRVHARRPRARVASGRDHHRGRRSPRRRDPAPLLQAGHAPGRQLPRLRGRDQGRARARTVVLSRADGGNGSLVGQRARAPRAEAGRRDARRGRSRARLQARFRARPLEALAGHRQAALRGARAARGRSVASGDGGQSRRLHPVHALRSRLPRGAGQRRHRLRVSRRRFQDRVRPGRSDGRVDVRGVRRMRAGVPDRRAGAGARRVPGRGRQEGVVAVPVLRRGLPAHLSRQGQPHRSRRRSRRAGQSRTAVREGALRVRLRESSAATHPAADPQAGHAEVRRFRHGSGRSALRVPRGELGRGDGARRRHAGANSRRARQRRARRLRLREGLQRGGLPFPEAGAHRLRHQQRRPLHAAVPRIERRRAARGHRLGRGVEPGDGRHPGRRGAAHRRQSGGQSPGRGDVDQERGQERDAGSSSPTRGAPSWPAMPRSTCSSSPTPTWRC